MNDYENYLYDKKYEKLRSKINKTKKEINEIFSVNDLFNNRIQTTKDIIKELEELNKNGVTSITFTTYDNEKCMVSIKRIYGLAQEDDYYFSTYEINYHNPRYELEAFYVDLIETLNKQYAWEKGFSSNNNIKTIGN